MENIFVLLCWNFVIIINYLCLSIFIYFFFFACPHLLSLSLSLFLSHLFDQTKTHPLNKHTMYVCVCACKTPFESVFGWFAGYTTNTTQPLSHKKSQLQLRRVLQSTANHPTNHEQQQLQLPKTTRTMRACPDWPNTRFFRLFYNFCTNSRHTKFVLPNNRPVQGIQLVESVLIPKIPK